MNLLLDEAGTPSVRAVLGQLLASAASADLAVAHVRLAAVDLSVAEASGIRCCRFLLGRLDAEGLLQIATGSGRGHLQTLRDLLASGRVEIRSAGVAAWVPDFSVFRGLRGGADGRDVCVLGAHYFQAAPVSVGPSFTCVLADTRAVDLAARRFDELWQRSHDVQAAVLDTVDRLLHDGENAG